MVQRDGGDDGGGGPSGTVLQREDSYPTPIDAIQPTDPTSSTRKPSDSSSFANLNTTSNIQHVYLTFQTALPAPNLTSSARLSPSAPPPPQPDLTPFIDPVLWPQRRKNLLLALSCIATFLTAYTAGSYSPPSNMMASLFSTSQVAVLAGITTFCTGFALAPMVLAPLSEINGRYPVFVASGSVYVLAQAACGLARGLPAMLVSRFLVGVGGSVFSTMVGGVIADMWGAQGRNAPMALFSGSVLAGTGAGPLVAAVITDRLGPPRPGDAWKWVFWHQVVVGGVLMVAIVVLFRESRGSVLLSRKARALNRWYEELERAGYFGVWMDAGEDEEERRGAGVGVGVGGGLDSEVTTLACLERSDWAADGDEEQAAGMWLSQTQTRTTKMALNRIRWLVKEDEERSSIAKMISISVYRPFHLLVTEPVVFFFSLWVAFAWAVLYLTFGSVFYVFSNVYDWNVEPSGRVFVAMIVGSGIATVIGICQEKLLKLSDWQPGSKSPSRFWAMMRRRFTVDVPESRLYFTCVTATFLPIGLFVFGFTARPDAHWMAPTIAVGLATMGIYSVYLATFNYLADVYHKYASSALAAQSFCRNILGGVFPIVTSLLFRNLGNARAGALLGGIATLLTFVPWVLVFFGERIRQRSKFAMVSEPLFSRRLSPLLTVR